MKNLPKINEIRRKAEQFGTPLSDVIFHGDGIEFIYSVGDRTSTHYYSKADDGIQEELVRLNNFLRVEKSLTSET